MTRDPASVLQEIDRIPPLPQVLQRVLDCMNNPKSSAREITEEIGQDPALTARLLKIVNSAYYGLGRQVSTLSHAVVLLGFTQVRSLVVASAMQDFWAASSKDDADRREALWRHCLGTALIAKELGRIMEHAQQEEMFIGGLLHDIGKIVLDRFWHEDYMNAVGAAREQGEYYADLEMDLLKDTTHSQLGALVAKKWNLPELFIDIITHHHNPSAAPTHRTEVSIVHVANCIARIKDIGDGCDGNCVPPIDETAWQCLNFSEADLPKIFADIDHRLENDVLLQETGIW